MAIHTKHPVSALPAAPVREKTSHLLLRGWCVFVLILAFAATGWVNALGQAGAGVVAAGAVIVSVVLWLVVRPQLQWRRLPWLALAFVAWAGLAIVWSASPGWSAIVWMLLLVATFQGLFVAVMLTWRDIVRAIASALKWVIGLSIVFEIAVALFVGDAVLPGFVATSADDPSAWARGNLVGEGSLHGVVGNSDLLGALMVLAIVVFAIRYAARAPRRPLLLAWIVVAALLLFRTGSVTAFIAAAGVTLVLTTVLLMRTAQRPGDRTRFYLLYAAAGIASGAVVWFAYRPALAESPNAWVDVFGHLGVVGVLLLAVALLAFVWRSWFFAVDRPRFDLRADRPYSPLSLLPTLLAALLLVEGAAQPESLLLWGWTLVALLGSKIKQAPLVGVGPAEQSLAIERGELQKP